MIGKIIGTGLSVPERIVDNNELATMVETSDEWIRERTGIVSRHISGNETTTSMAIEAARKALLDAKLEAENIDMIIVSTLTPDSAMPTTAALVQAALGANKACCFDINSACSGFVYGYNTAIAYINAGIYKNILVVGSECLSNIVDWTDRRSCILFGDGAGACVVSGEYGGSNVVAGYSDGAKGNALMCQGIKDKSKTEHKQFIEMDGQEVFKFAVRKVPEIINEVVKKAGLELKDIDLFVLHQANLRIIESVAKRLGEDIMKFPTNMQKYGNTSSASIPILLDELNKEGRLKRGDRIVMAGFGGGLSWGAVVLEW